MTRSFTMQPEGMWLRNSAGVDVFSTDHRAFGLVTEAALTGTVTLSFPSLIAGGVEYRYSRGAYGSGYAESCATIGWISDQNWGPGLPLNIEPVLLGDVPEGADFLDVEASFVRTSVPGNIIGYPILAAVKEGEQTSLFDGGAILEDRGRIKRGVHVSIIDGKAYASLYQSAAQQNVQLIESKENLNVFAPGSLPVWAFHQTGPSPCSSAISINLASAWQMTYKVTPGRITS